MFVTSKQQLAFFAADKSTYAVPRIPCARPSIKDEAISILRKESRELKQYLSVHYQLNIDICPKL